ncbi:MULTISPECIES: metallophosphoesterase family protein [Sporosarcina]|uniref:metallophosphoesterase family protein n=1 Tax=Sporosarcina TaxID=1569 RepID=UPI000693D86C|nr:MULTISPECIES: metallophosphoesterase family protein [Sporosarcina]WJY27910.1 metallophosphoesterase family protein [Sporosarcina sp. 0.2-SM1T-5]
MQRTLVISDIHGEAGMLDALLEKAEYIAGKDRLILLGDYIDRGPDSKGVVDRVIQLVKNGAVALQGNHEHMMIRSLTEGHERTWRNWTGRNGGDATLKSYGFEPESFLFRDEEEFIQPVLSDAVLARHLAFLQRLPVYMEEEDTVFVHAGVKPDVPLAETDPYDLVWIRDEFHSKYAGPKTIVFGHTPVSGLHGDPDSHHIFFGANSIIGIDGGAVFGGQLNCLVLPEKKEISVPADHTHKKGPAS